MSIYVNLEGGEVGVMPLTSASIYIHVYTLEY